MYAGEGGKAFLPFRRCELVRYQAVHFDEVEDIRRWISLCGVTTPNGAIYRGIDNLALLAIYILSLPSDCM